MSDNGEEAKYCHAHHCPEPCYTCRDDQDWKRAWAKIAKGHQELEDLYKRAKGRRNKALRQIGVLAVELAEVRQHKPSDTSAEAGG